MLFDKDILKEKRIEVAKLARQADDAVDLVSRTINDLESINRQLDENIAEIDSYVSELNTTRAHMCRQHRNNTAIVHNFSKLLNLDEDSGDEDESAGEDAESESERGTESDAEDVE